MRFSLFLITQKISESELLFSIVLYCLFPKSLIRTTSCSSQKIDTEPTQRMNENNEMLYYASYSLFWRRYDTKIQKGDFLGG